jgi:tetratricopeptide (TPR) repeat protein
MEKKTLAEFLKQASNFFDAGEVVKAGQIWQAILKKDPSIAEAKKGLLSVKAALSKNAKPAPMQSPPAARPTSAEQFLREGCSLYDSGALTEALEAWEKVLAIDPGHYLALSYTRGVRKELGLPVDPAPSPPQGADAGSPPEMPPPPEQRLEAPNTQVAAISEDQAKAIAIIERGSQLYKVGNIEDAVDAWESALAIDPGNVLAKGYLTTARNDLDARPAVLPPPLPNESSPMPPASMPPASTPPLLLPRPAPFDPFGQSPSGLAASEGPPAEQARQKDDGPKQTGSGEKTIRIPGLATGSPIATIRPIGVKNNAPAQIPSMITSAQDPKRQGPAFSHEIKKLPLLSRLASPLSFIFTFGLLLMLGAGGFWFVSSKKDALLKATQAAIKDGAIKSARQSVKEINLPLTTEELKAQARSAMGNNPLRAYMLIQEIISRDPTDSSAPKLLDQAQQAMAAAPKTSTADADLSRFMADGNLNEAAALLEARLRQNPNNMRAREDLARICLLQARASSKQGNWGAARTRLLMGAALFPKDLTWQARLKLVEHMQSALKEDQQSWAEMLG